MGRGSHVEAGLRSFDRLHPFPEEINRRITGLVADQHFCPTIGARRNLIREGVPADAITVTGNTVVDALLWITEKIRQDPPPMPAKIERIISSGMPFVLITGHRRESFGDGFQSICLAIRYLASLFPHVTFIYPVHLNPNVQKPVMDILSNVPGVLLIQPQAYRQFIRLMDACTFILTDSGGIQEEAPSLGKPVLVMRNVTERPEGVEAGVSRLVGTDTDVIVAEASKLLTDQAAYNRMARAQNPYGDGTASEKIFQVMSNDRNGTIRGSNRNARVRWNFKK